MSSFFCYLCIVRSFSRRDAFASEPSLRSLSRIPSVSVTRRKGEINQITSSLNAFTPVEFSPVTFPEHSPLFFLLRRTSDDPSRAVHARAKFLSEDLRTSREGESGLEASDPTLNESALNSTRESSCRQYPRSPSCLPSNRF